MAHLDHLPQEMTLTPDHSLEPADIVISGTTMWNPGDDFVRGGVIAVLRRLYHPRPLNLFFYNFSADVLPPYGKLGDRGNNIAAGDLTKLGRACDAVVIAGLSAGREIKDLYDWAVEAGLTDRVYLIGAGYENTYVEKHCSEQPEATIFKDARFIVGRTRKKPGFLESLGTPYAHLPCPSLLSVDRVKEVPAGKPVKRIGFSIQLPHEDGIVNQATGADCANLAVETMLSLAASHEIILIAHHKTEYLEFARRYKGTGIRVAFQSFFQDLADIYRDLDLVVTTRLHAGLYANAHGIPAIIINDTDRHTHALEGFGHAVWVNDRKAIDSELERVFSSDLRQTAHDLSIQKLDLMDRYLEVLSDPFGASRTSDAELGTQSPSREEIGRELATACGAPAVKNRALSIISKLTPDHWLKGNIEHFRHAASQQATWFDTLTVLNWWARAMRPRTYLEVGVRRGRSMAQVLVESPATHAFGFDLWLPAYGSIPSEGIAAENPGPEFVSEELHRIGAGAPAQFTVGNSSKTVPAFFDIEGAPQEIDLILVDGDHTEEGARADLEIAFGRLAPGGAIIFDDLTHPSHPGLRGVWHEFKQQHPEWLFIEDPSRSGTGVAVRPPFDRLAARLRANTAEAREHALQATSLGAEPAAERLIRRLIKPGMTALDLGAHAGRYTRAMSLLVGPDGKVLSVEPSPASIATLRDRVRCQRLDNVIIEPLAVSDTNGTATLNEFGEALSSWSSLGKPLMERTPGDPSTAIEIESKKEVQTIRPEDLCDAHGIEHVDYLKLDVEGAEPAAIRGLERLLASASVSFIQFEVSGRTIEGMNANPREIFDVLAKHGYRAYTITESGGFGDPVRDSQARHSQYIAVAPNVQPRRSPADHRTPIHFFTIVLNGMPFMTHHMSAFQDLEGPWHWHIIEGVANLVHDTNWSVGRGGKIPQAHHGGRSIDGTSELIDQLAAAHPDKITVYRKPPGQFWDGKREMVNAPLANIIDPCLLWQIDADEIWTTLQIETARRMFAERPLARAAFYRCRYFVGPDRVITSLDTYGNHTGYEWLRTWRYAPGCRWQAHEPPRLVTPNPDGTRTDLAEIHPILHETTERLGLVFQHYAYATEDQLRFKETYYGYEHAVDHWRRLQAAEDFPLKLRDYFHWVRDEATVERAAAIGVTPIFDLEAPSAAHTVVRRAGPCVAS